MSKMIQIKAVKKNGSYFKIVNSFKGCEVGTTYATKNYKLFTPLPGNRGSETGYIPGKVSMFEKLIDEGKFEHDTIHRTLNLTGLTIDGNNKGKSLENKEHYINFDFTAAGRFNEGSISDIKNEVSDWNSWNTRWSAHQAFLSALMDSECGAVAVREIDAWMEKTFGDYFDVNSLRPSRYIGLALKNNKILQSQAQPRSSYTNIDTANIINSPEFYDVMGIVGALMKMVVERNYTFIPFNIIRALMPLIWNYDKITLARAFHKIITSRTSILNGYRKIGEIRARLNKDDILGKKLSPSATLVKWTDYI